MRHARSRAFQAFALPAVVLLGAVNLGCPGGNGSQGAAGAPNTGGGGAGGDTTSSGGSGGSTCVAETEICDGADNDCDGQVDNVPNLPPAGCACDDGETQPCYAGPPGTENIGACIGGSQTCANGAWGACVGQVVPASETCNLKDDDCNGTADDLGMVTCGVGECAEAVTKCVAGQIQPCVPGAPETEVCDGLDNNCNQFVDESDPLLDTSCQTGTPGVCANGLMKCVDKALVCTGTILPTAEACDGKDTDCDGIVDNNVPGTGGLCSTGALGVCEPGTISCKLAGGTYQVDCFANVPQSPEVCDSKDNDCDGSSDENNPGGGGACDTGKLGVCQIGTLNCVGGSVQCTQNTPSAVETCNAKDDNCDGQVDEGAPGAGVPCGCAGAAMGTTSCTNGQILCSGGGPIVYFTEEFANNAKGWTFETGWQIGPTVQSSGQAAGYGTDPALDHTPTSGDNGIAGAYLGGNVPIVLSPLKYLTSPAINLSGKAGSMVLTYWRILNSDYPPYMDSTLEVKDGGGVWVKLFSVPSLTTVKEQGWTKFTHEVSSYAGNNPSFQIRWGYSTSGSSATDIAGGWNIDDVTLATAACP